VVHWAIEQGEHAVFDMRTDEMVSDADVLCPRLEFPVSCQSYGSLVVTEDGCGEQGSLVELLGEVLQVEYLTRNTRQSNVFCFCGG
jgi:hypothetical protein